MTTGVSVEKKPLKLDLNGLLSVLDVVVVRGPYSLDRQCLIVPLVGRMDHPAQLDCRPSGRLPMWCCWEHWTGKGSEKGVIPIDAHPICSQLRAFCFGHVQRAVSISRI